MQKKTILSIAIIAALCLTSVAQAEVINARVSRVIDGDTIDVVTEDDNFRVRIRGIDAPESKQEFGDEARWALDELLNGHTVILKSSQKDRYGRVLASVAVSDTDVGLYMIEHGYAWFYEDYGHQIPKDWQTAYRMAETDAKAARAGLWIASGAVPPWTWRKQKREADKVDEQIRRDSLEGITAELETDLKTLEDGLSGLKKEYFSDKDSKGEINEEDNEPLRAPDEKLSWLELAMKLGEGFSRWIKAFFLSFFE